MRLNKTVNIKTYKPIENEKSVLDKIVTSFANDPEGYGYLDDCMSMDLELNRRVPLRYRIIAKGFVTGSSLEEVNEKLQKAGCSTLYSRSIWEAGIIYAFSRRLSYDEWKQLQQLCTLLREEQEEALGDKYFQGSGVSLADIRAYIDDNSNIDSEGLRTQHLTRAMNRKIKEAGEANEEFGAFLISNMEAMSLVREKTRYYFCKYLYYYLATCIERYLKTRPDGIDTDDHLVEIAMFRGITKLKRRMMSDEEVRILLNDSNISFGEIFDAFNYYYFDYVSLDWMEVLLEYYGKFDLMPEDEKAELAASLRKYDASKYAKLSDEEVLELKQKELDLEEELLDKEYAAGSEAAHYQKDRAGENTIRRYIKGSLDIDRITLICFLMFFSNNSDLPEDMKISVGRLNTIMSECGFSELRSEDEFDYFVIKFIETDEPVDCLIETVTDYALDEENFFLYRMYRASRNADEDIRKII